ncbi:MAG: hypothetical protein NC131_18150, partial [Roseburia sp.]|nr:hypothetical protein [Roseburia sp.]
MAKKDKPIELIPIPGGPYDEFIRKRRTGSAKIPKDSYTYLTTLLDINGSDNIENLSEVGIGDYSYNKGIVHAMNMNVGRNVPWIEDGLKSVERRVLYTMYIGGFYGKKSTKVASIVGAMIEKFYPHGDRAPADTIYRLGRTKTMMLPYIQELGNYGNMEDLKPAASRYAEAALTDYAKDCFFGDIGPRRPLYDEKDSYEYTTKEPIYLISRYPNILMQWNLGIGKGAMSWLGAFNSIDLMKACLELMDNPRAKIDIYPDAPVPVEIINKSELRGCFDKPKFKVKMRAPYHAMVDQRRVGTKIEDKYALVFTAMPIGVTGEQIRDEIVAIRTEKGSKRLQEVINVDVVAKDDTPGGIEIIVEYERGYDPNVLAEKLFKSTSLARTIGVQYKLIIGNKPESRTPREILLQWINQRYDQKRRYYHQMVLQSAIDRAIYDALTIVIGNDTATDKTISLIRKSKGQDEAVAALRKEYGLTEFQAKQVVNIKLGTLTKMNIEEVIKKRDEAITSYKQYRKLLGDEDAVKEAVRGEIEDGLKKYGRQRIAKLRNLKGGTIGEPNEEKFVIYNNDFYYCITDPSRLSGVVDKINNGYRMVKIKNGDNVLVFDRNGVLKILNGYAFTATENGIAMSTLGVSNVSSIMSDTPGKGYNEVVMVTEQGYGKRMEMSEVTKSVKSRVINLNTDDRLAAVIPVKGDCHPDSIIGMTCGDTLYYLKVDDFPVYKRSSAGNRIIKNVKDLCVSNAIYFDASENPDYMLIYGESGYIKLLDTAFLSFSKRGNN